ncbi:hypothetical protein PR048_003177 [Dryococelus australis]|uniref:Uncharacterized protein n=1 Tax=Dryococelus australis TaxID=614101 RepID=A0ABQ9IME6_9NEOP|nr:hypothetical protein PR048_003177 [Dryococelus australis]
MKLVMTLVILRNQMDIYQIVITIQILKLAVAKLKIQIKILAMNVNLDCQEKNGEYVEQQSHQQSDQISEDSKVKSYYGKNWFKWCSKPAVKNVRTPKHNIISHSSGLKGPAKSLHDTAAPLDATLQAKYSRENKPELADLDCEFDALSGVLYYWSVFKSNHEDLESLFATDGTGREIFRCVTPVERLLVLLACFRFDNPEDREQRKQNDPSTTISWIFNELVKKNSHLS